MTPTPEVVSALFDELATHGSLRRACRDSSMPLERTVRRWCVEDPQFEAAYARAKQMGIEAMVDETVDIADDGTNDWIENYDREGKHIGWKLNGEHIQRSKVRIETRYWLAERLMPKRYGVRSGLDVTSSDGSLAADPETRAKRLAALVAQAQARKAASASPEATAEVDIDDLV